MNSNCTASTASPWPVFYLISGLIFTVAAIIFACADLVAATTICAVVIAAIALLLTFVIATNQNSDTAQITKILLEVKEQRAQQEYGGEGVSEGIACESHSDFGTQPSYAREAIDALKSASARLDFGNLQWRQKIPSNGLKGNQGWFVETPDGEHDERWFVRKANGMTVRKAMPRELLDALEKFGQVGPREIQLDFQNDDHGLAAWYARTYAGDLWRVSRSNRNRANINVTKISGDK